MNLSEVMCATTCAQASFAGGTVHIMRATDESAVDQCYWYDIKWSDGRRAHSDPATGVYGEQADLVVALEECLGFDPSLLDWQRSEQMIDLSDCHCRECREFLLMYGIIPEWLPFRERACYWLTYRVRRAWWWCECRWITLRWRGFWSLRRQSHDDTA